ncbi:hypothetical protein [Nocardioides sp. W7]|uniref:hypothetical protein n=1 Tax=Nocardioides sp. W7 TaxID=2931390 RepID=UPI001FD10303|nr:hypothetical protein [Nocardioides sp. W7]
MPTAVRSLLAALLATVASVGVGIAVVGPNESDPAPRVTADLTLADLDTSVLAARRAGFCPGITAEQVAGALGGEPTASASYDNGEQVAMAEEVTDVAHEFGCSWTGADGAVARGWVFAPPVPAERARRLARAAVRTPGCRALPEAEAYGAPSVAVVCADGDGRVVSYRGLFGDAWLSCSLSAPAAVARAELVDRADRWCAAVAVASTSDAG